MPAPVIEGYEDITEVGRGGFAVVYRAFDPAFQRTVAIKVIGNGDLDPMTRDRFSRECAAMGRLSDHPHIVTVYQSDTMGAGHLYLVMPYLPSGSLQDRLDKEGPLPWEEVVEITIKVAGALGTASCTATSSRRTS